MSDLAIFRLEFESNIFIFEIGILKFVYLQNFTKKQKCLNLGPKILDLGIFGLEFKHKIVIFEFSTLEVVHLQNFAEKEKCLKLEPKCLICVVEPYCEHSSTNFKCKPSNTDNSTLLV